MPKKMVRISMTMQADKKAECRLPDRTIWSDPDIRIVHLESSFFSGQTPKHNHSDCICLFFCLCGKIRVRAVFEGQVRDFWVPDNCCHFHYSPNGCMLECEGAKKSCQGLMVTVGRCLLTRVIAEENAASIYERIRADQVFAHQQILPMTSGMRSVVNELLHPGFAKGPVHLFYLAKILELICNIVAIDELTPFNDTCPSNMQIIQKSIACMEEAMDNPPSIGELAGRVGVSASKLKQLFPHICGTTPYAYLRRLRMEKAISLLRQGEMNVTEVAYAVGYDSISHFSKLFYQYHGMRPSRVRRQACAMMQSGPEK